MNSDTEIDFRMTLQCRFFAADTGVFNASGSLGDLYPCQPVGKEHLDGPEQRS